jgi:hypothetical protein
LMARLAARALMRRGADRRDVLRQAWREGRIATADALERRAAA